MAAFVKIWDDRAAILMSVMNTACKIDVQRKAEYKAAVVIQSWFRGCKTRTYIRYLNECAVIIQKNYRAFRGRNMFRKLLMNTLKAMKDQHYHFMAVKIQSAWRGYYVRKYVFCYYSQREYLLGLIRKNSSVRSSIQHLEESKAAERLQNEEKQQKVQDYEEAMRHHYMLSTKTKDGIFKVGNTSSTRPSFEDRMRSIKFMCKDTTHSKPHHPLPSIQSQDRLSNNLHLVTNNKIQGPFKSPSDVWKKRLTPLNPSLRVATAYDSEEVARMELKAKEWRNRVHDEKFLPFTKLHHQYQPMLHTKSQYINSVHRHQFREEQPDRNISEKFATVVPPIPLFDQL